MNIHADFKALLELFNAQRVEYIVVGAYALAYHGAPRYTGDMDVYVRPTPGNAARVLSALEAFGFGSLGLTTTDFEKEGQVVQLGVPPVRIDIITAISGVTWAQADAGKVSGTCGGFPVFFLGREEFSMNKRASGRKKDLADLEALGE
jgi:hypothetical protein